MDGILTADKPEGITSHAAVQRLRRATGERRVGHAGTLDPPASGLLVLGIGRATRVLRFLDVREKEYRARVRLGWETTTQDAWGEPTGTPVEACPAEDAVQHALEGFRGRIRQVPPMVSALKVRGERLYRYARRGETVDRPAREIEIYRLELTRFDPPWLELDVVCSPGTYVRALANDLGRALGCGAHLAALRRVRAGRFGVDEALALDARVAPERFEVERRLLPMEDALSHLPAVRLDEEASRAVRHGAPEAFARCDTEHVAGGAAVRVVAPDERLLAIARRGDPREDLAGGCGLRLECVLVTGSAC